MTTKSTVPDEGSVAVPFATAHEQTKNYRDFIQPEGINEIAFFIKTEDLISALQLPAETTVNPNITGIRVYMALEHLPENKKRSHVYVVATDADQNDITKDSNNNSLIYDMTWPCPNICSKANVLNTDSIEN
jgi:hypothetical protein